MKTIIFNGNIYIENNVYAEALLIEDNKVVAYGSNEEIISMSSEATKIDAFGKAVIPGFNDSHIHLYSLGKSLRSVQLYGCTSIEEVIARSRKFIKDNNVPEGTFVTGRGWNQDYFTDESRMINKHDLDKISTKHPIVFNRACGHVASCNSLALEVCNVNKDTLQIEGSEFYYDEDKTPNGIFAEAAIKVFLEDNIPSPSIEEMTETLKTAVDYALSQGITSVQTNDINSENYDIMIKVYENLYNNSLASTRSYHQCFFTTTNEYKEFIEAGYVTGKGNDYNKIGPLKMFVDGSLGARTALMRNAYADDSSTNGIACMTQEHINSMVSLANDNNCQVAIHAIGDKAIEMVLDSYEDITKESNDLRHGIIHCQITDEGLINRFKENDILAYVQPIFIHYDMHIVADRVGEELASTSYAFGDMFRKGINVSYGTDCPVEDLKTMDNLYCAVIRKDLKAYPENGYYSNQAVSIEDAIMLYTQAGAYNSKEENIKGKLLPGYLADVVILDTDIFNMDLENLRDVKVNLTIVGGKVAYKL